VEKRSLKGKNSKVRYETILADVDSRIRVKFILKLAKFVDFTLRLTHPFTLILAAKKTFSIMASSEKMFTNKCDIDGQPETAM